MEREEAKKRKEKDGLRLTLIHNGVIVTMDDESRVFSNGAIVVEGDRIRAIGRSSEILDRFSPLADEIVDLQGRIVLPGFVNTHVHTSQQLGRGIADDVDLLTWLHERIWPYESNMTEEDSYLSTLLCGIELIRSGVTCFAEAGGQHVPGMARAVELLGIRACLTESTMDSGKGLPSVWSARSADACIQSQRELYSRHHGAADGRIRVWLGIRQIMNATDQLLLETRSVAKELKTGIHMMYLASLINKGREAFTKGATDPTAVPAETVLKMVTIDCAKAVLWDDEIGSFDVDKKADLVVTKPFTWSMVPVHDCISSLVYCMRTENIESVMCNGHWIMRDQKILTVEEDQIITQAKHASIELLKRAGIKIPTKMNVL